MKKDVGLSFNRLKTTDIQELTLPENELEKSCYIDCISMLSDILAGLSPSSQCGYFQDIFEGCTEICSSVKKIINNDRSKFRPYIYDNYQIRIIGPFKESWLDNPSISLNILINLQVALKLFSIFNPDVSEVVSIEVDNYLQSDLINNKGSADSIGNNKSNIKSIDILNKDIASSIKVYNRVYWLTMTFNDAAKDTDHDDAQRLIDTFITELILQYKDIVYFDPSTPDSSAINLQSNPSAKVQ